MTPALRAEISALSPTPPPATDRLEEQAHAANLDLRIADYGSIALDEVVGCAGSALARDFWVVEGAGGYTRILELQAWAAAN